MTVYRYDFDGRDRLLTSRDLDEMVDPTSDSGEALLTAGVGSTYHRTDGGAATCLYVKESGTGNTGWVAK